MESDDFTRHYIIRYLSACELVLPGLCSTSASLIPRHHPKNWKRSHL